MKRENADITYSLPLESIVGGRYLIQKVRRVQEDQIVYLAADLVEKKQVELIEYFPQELVTRDGAGGEENVTVLPGGQEKLQQQIRQFEKEYDNTVRDHHTVYAVSEVRNGNGGKKPVGTIMLCMAVILVGIVMSVSLFLPVTETKNSAEGETVYYGEEDTNYILRPSEDTICVDETENVEYYDRMVIAYLQREPTEEEIASLTASVNGKLTGQIKGGIDYLQIELPESGFDKIQEAAKTLMSNELVRYADYDYPLEICDDLSGTDTNPWNLLQQKTEEAVDNALPSHGNEALDHNISFGCGYDEDKPSGNNWWAEAIGAYTAWNEKGNAIANTVGILDNGFDTDHEDLQVDKKNNLGIRFTNIKQKRIKQIGEIDVADHGTLVAGVIGASNNNIGIRGVASDHMLLLADWSEMRNGEETERFSSGEVIVVLAEMIKNGACVVNNSWGNAGTIQSREQYEADQPQMSYEKYCERHQKEVERYAKDSAQMIVSLMKNGKEKFMFVQSAGNGYLNAAEQGMDSRWNGYFCSLPLLKNSDFLEKYVDGYTYEAISNHVLVVGGVRWDGKNTYNVETKVNYGDYVDIYAPCNDIYSTLSNNAYGTVSGTSLAAPMVSGSVALLWDMCSTLRAEEIKKYLCDNSRKISFAERDAGNDLLDPESTASTAYMLNIGNAVIDLKQHMGEYEDRNEEALREILEDNLLNLQKPEEKQEKDKEDEVLPDKVPKDLFEQYLQSTLIPQYGLMSTDSWQLSTSLETWEKGDDSPMDGILSALIQDLDGDGQEEMLVVRFTPGDKGRMYLEVYEANGQNVGLQDEVDFDTSDYCKYRWDARLTVFAKAYQGETSLYLYAYDDSGNDFTDETIQQLRYRDNSLKISKYWHFETKWDRSVWLESGTVKDADCNRRQLISWQEEGWYDESHIKEVLTQEKTLGSDDNVDTSTAEYQEELNTLLAEMYADLQSETGLTFKRCADTDMVNGMIAHTLIWSGRDLFYNHGEDDSTYVAALDNQYRDDKNTIVPFDYTEIVRK